MRFDLFSGYIIADLCHVPIGTAESRPMASMARLKSWSVIGSTFCKKRYRGGGSDTCVCTMHRFIRPVQAILSGLVRSMTTKMLVYASRRCALWISAIAVGLRKPAICVVDIDHSLRSTRRYWSLLEAFQLNPALSKPRFEGGAFSISPCNRARVDVVSRTLLLQAR